MAQLVSIYDKLTKEYQIIDVDRGVQVASFSNQQVATSFVNTGVVTPQTIQQAVAQDVNYSGGVQTPEQSTTTSNPPDPQVSASPTPTVPVTDIETTPADVNPTVNPQVADPVVAEVPITAVNPGSYTPDQLNEIATAQGVGGEEGFITSDTLARDPGSYTAAELNAIADAQGVGGEEGFITSDTLARDPGSFTADELNAIADAQGVGGEEGFITSDTLAKDPGSYSAAELDAIAAAQGVDAGDVAAGGITESQMYGDEGAAQSAFASAGIQNAVQNAQAQQTISQQRKQINNGDWRVRLRLAPQANYLYNAPQPGILQPLKVTDGIIFPYTPQIDTNYRANYTPYDLTHSNYRGYFYQSSYVDSISLKATFTAQDTNDANYLLAVITFLKSATKMFYGQDAQRGTPPPVLYLTGFGDYQFKENPCVLSTFAYSLPDNVDYIRAQSPNNVGLNLLSIRDRQSVATNAIFGQLNRLAAAFLSPGAINQPAAPPTLGLNSPTYVPTKMDINLTLLPMQSRQQISKQFSLKGFANGDLIKGGFW